MARFISKNLASDTKVMVTSTTQVQFGSSTFADLIAIPLPTILDKNGILILDVFLEITAGGTPNASLKFLLDSTQLGLFTYTNPPDAEIMHYRLSISNQNSTTSQHETIVDVEVDPTISSNGSQIAMNDTTFDMATLHTVHLQVSLNSPEKAPFLLKGYALTMVNP